MADPPAAVTAGPARRHAVVIGSPIEHSLSPAIHNAAFRQAGLDWHYFALAVPAGEAGAALGLMRDLGLAGMSVTMPHKDAVAAHVDSCTPVATRLNAVNCVTWDGDRLIGDNTDGAGFIDAIAAGRGFDPLAKRAVVFGAGGAARAVVLALAGCGAADVCVVNRSHDRALSAASLAAAAGEVARPGECAAQLGDADLVVNATSLGMGDGRMPLDPRLLHRGQLVVDLVYQPLETPLLAAAAAQGAETLGGLGMLVHQAAHAFGRWTGLAGPVETMTEAAVGELARRQAGTAA